MKHLFHLLDLRTGGLLLFSFIFLVADFQMIFAVILNVMIHELGHVIALKFFGCRIYRIIIDYTGVCIQSNLNCISNKACIVIALSGPIFGEIFGLFAAFMGNLLHNEFLLLTSGIGLLFTLFNLLPAKPLDGWRVLFSLLPNYSHMIGVSTSLLLLILGVTCLYCGYGSGLAFMGIILLLQDYDD